MYVNNAACIELDNKITETFLINIGVKQGDNPSPTLFNLYLHDLPKHFSDTDIDRPLLMTIPL